MADEAARGSDREASSELEPPTLAPLACSACGRLVPLGLEDVACCRACGCEVPIPESYLALRAAARLDAEARARAVAISEELARPASLFVRFWTTAGAVALVFAVLLVLVWLLVALVMCLGTFADGGPIGALIMLTIGFVLGLPLLYDEALHGLAEPLRVDLADVWSGAGAYAVLGLAIVVVTIVPLVLAAYAESFEAVRAALRTALAAAPAADPGGAERCRMCGAALEEHADELHARCLYCGADNLVHLGEHALATLETAKEVACTSLESAIALATSTARAGRRHVAVELANALLLVPVCILLGRCVAGVNDDDATFWQPAVASAPMIPRGEDNPLLPRATATRFDVGKYDGCYDDECWTYYFVALEAGETPWIAVEGADVRLVEIARRHVGPWYDPTYEWRATELAGGAPYAGWYRVKLVTARPGSVIPRLTWDASR